MKPTISYCEETIALVHNIEGAFIALGERLHRIRNERMWEGRWDSYEDYLSEINISPAKASKITSIYEKYVLEYNVPQDKLVKVGWSSLYSLLPAVKDKESANEWVDKASVLRREDIEDEIRDIKLGAPCPHKNTEILKLEICKDCGKRWKIYET